MFVSLILEVTTSLGNPEQNFVEIAYLSQGLSGQAGLSGYDADHDGLEEVLLSIGWGVQIYEHAGNNQYFAVFALSGRQYWAVGDIDGDGLTDIAVSPHDSLEVFESPTPDSYPSECVWQWEKPYPADAPITWITDLDQDGRKEMLVSHAGAWIYIFENTGDNTYTKVFEEYVYPPYGSIGEICHGDFDVDGKTEFVTSDSYGNVIVYENVAVGLDSFALTWAGSVPTRNANYVAAANDMDRDGRPEFVVGGPHSAPGGWLYVFTVFETIGDDMYEFVWCDSSFPFVGLGAYGDIACGDVDRDGVDEMLFSTGTGGVYLYKCAGPDTYVRIWQFPHPDRVWGVLIYDLNRNGYGELVISGRAGTWIYEKEIVGVEETQGARSPGQEAALFENCPNPFGSGGTIISFTVNRERCNVSLAIYDLRGRLVKTLVYGKVEPGCHRVVWDGRDEHGDGAPSGVYFCRLVAEDSGLTAVKKMVIVR